MITKLSNVYAVTSGIYLVRGPKGEGLYSGSDPYRDGSNRVMDWTFWGRVLGVRGDTALVEVQKPRRLTPHTLQVTPAPLGEVAEGDSNKPTLANRTAGEAQAAHCIDEGFWD